MKWDRTIIPAGDILFRGVLYPSAFLPPQAKSDLLRLYAPEKALQLRFENQSHTLETSIVWRKLAPLTCQVHSYGCRVAAQRNLRNTVGTKALYCGAYEFTVDAIRDGCSRAGIPELQNVDALHLIEGDEIAHAHLRFHLRSGLSKNQIEDVKVALVDAVYRVMKGPLVHICDVDRGMSHHPNAKLPAAPKGAYFDDRNLALLTLDFMRFAFWKLSYEAAHVFAA